MIVFEWLVLLMNVSGTNVNDRFRSGMEEDAVSWAGLGWVWELEWFWRGSKARKEVER